MKTSIFAVRRVALGLLLTILLAATGFTAAAQPVDTNILVRLKALKALVDSLHPQQGKVDLKNGLASITLPDNFRYLSPTDAATVIYKIWGNPPGPAPLGMIIPAGVSVLAPDSWAVIITYDNDGYVKDADASKIDYAELLHKMQEATRDGNKAREEQHYPTLELVGWATPPVYDKEVHKMYWAKEIRFSDSPENTLNYNVRVLGRHGVLVLNTVAPMSIFPQVQKQTPDIVKMVDFNSGNRYADFDKSTDKVAAYGLAALVLGGIAAKAGFFKLLLVGLLAAKKFVILGAVAVASFAKRLFKRKSRGDSTPTV